MLAAKIADAKYFMNKFLYSDMFDHFLLVNATISTFITHHIDGKVNLNFFSDEDDERALWSESPYIAFANIRSYCLEIIKGRRTPLSFQFVFMLSKNNQSRTISHFNSTFLPEDITGMFLNLNFQNKQLICTSGISYRFFTLDKTLENEWDRLILVFLKNNGIIYEVL